MLMVCCARCNGQVLEEDGFDATGNKIHVLVCMACGEEYAPKTGAPMARKPTVDEAPKQGGYRYFGKRRRA
jgi:hypothetical protein